MSTYYLLINGETKGEYSQPQIKAMYDSGAITTETLYWTDGLPEWKPVDGLFQQQAIVSIAAPQVARTTKDDNRPLDELEA